MANTHGCAAEADCINTAGSFICTCKDGYQGNGKTCKGTEISKALLIDQLFDYLATPDTATLFADTLYTTGNN